MNAIELSNVTKRYGDVTALDDVTLSVAEGEIFGFLGPNGAGKSTTIDILLDFVRPTAGSASVLGRDVQADSLAVRQRVGVLPDGYHLYDRLTARQHLEFAVDSKEADDDIGAVLERVGLADAADRTAGGFSKGMKQRLVLAMALVGEPDVLILDEPTTGLDPNGARRMREIIREERDRGATVFFSSHILEQVEAVCDRVGILRDGRIVAVDTIDALRGALDSEARLTLAVEPMGDEVIAAIAAVEGVSSVRDDGDERLSVACEEAAKTAVLAAVEATGARLLDFDTEDVSLEELFAAYTQDAPDASAETAADTPAVDDEATEVRA
ncbi:ABC transporter ATP-binding protein [Halorubrum sp. Atlit-8R]|uniref:ABC transporter ATP-binding protein n=1 Tax=unclassified Halorubrum TaxID=2642239 RepID=UPI000EF26042|nr:MULTISPECIES: ABC transporter ATP-binding protein [unclassified Halorubrum]RLM68169.1 ABC transporter ATP-binding protein [Halorubrum sp. Atlit-9R]RLM81399.1 ABC transporter ATP-binding protein [Halorubrum sp. Atlit-8R]